MGLYTLESTKESFFYSSDIKVFPCSYRNNYTIIGGDYQGQSYAFDPESRLNTEYNYLSISGKSAGQSNYIISFTKPGDPNSKTGLLKCVIGGYYFEINNFNLDDLKEYNEAKEVIGVKKLYVKSRKIALKEHSESKYGEVQIDSDRYTFVLGSWLSESATLLDYSTDGLMNYFFTGIKCTAENITDPNIIGILEVGVLKNNEVILNQEALLSTTYHGAAENAIKTEYYDKETSAFNYNIATGINSVAIGKETKATGENTLSTGYNTEASGENSVVTGYGAIARGNNSHAEGYYSNSTKSNTYGVGQDGDSGHSEGYNTFVNGTAGHAEGHNTQVLTRYSHAEGTSTLVLKEDPTTIATYNTEKDSDISDASGEGSHAEGYKTVTIAKYAHAEGEETKAFGKASHTEGYKTVAYGDYSHATGYETKTIGSFSSSNGNNTTASSKGDFVVGNSTISIANNKGYQTVVGSYNEVTEGQFIVGTGETDSTRKNTVVVNDNLVTITDSLNVRNSFSTSASSSCLKSNEIELRATKDLNILSPSLNIKTAENSGIVNINKNSLRSTKFNNIILTTNNIKNEETEFIKLSIGEFHNGSTSTSLSLDKKVIELKTPTFKINNVANEVTITSTNDTNSTNITLTNTSNNNKANLYIDLNNLTINNNSTSLFKIDNDNSKVSIKGGLYITDGGKPDNIKNVVLIDSKDFKVKYNELTGLTSINTNGPITTDAKLTAKMGITTDGAISSATYCNYANEIIWSHTNKKSPGAKLILNYTNNNKTKEAYFLTATPTEGITLDATELAAPTITLKNNTLIKGTTEFSKAANFREKINIDKTRTLTSGNNYIVINTASSSGDKFKINVNGTDTLRIGYGGDDVIQTKKIRVSCGSNWNSSNSNEEAFAINKAASLSNSNTAFGIYVSNSNSTGTSNRKFSITYGGDVTATSYNATSDKRLKENIKSFEYKKSILDLPIYSFDFIDGTKNQVGCLAQDLQELYPELVTEDSSGYLAIKENKLIYLLLEEVKLLKTQLLNLTRK